MEVVVILTFQPTAVVFEQNTAPLTANAPSTPTYASMSSELSQTKTFHTRRLSMTSAIFFLTRRTNLMINSAETPALSAIIKICSTIVSPHPNKFKLPKLRMAESSATQTANSSASTRTRSTGAAASIKMTSMPRATTILNQTWHPTLASKDLGTLSTCERA